MRANPRKIYWIYFLSGFALWYGIEKLFMQNIGIDAVGIGWAVIVLQGSNVLLDIPTGILADRWSRKGMLLVSSAAMVSCCLLMGSSNSLGLYLFGVMAYSLHIVSLYTTADALQYDTLAELGETAEYDKASGHAGLLNLSAYAAGSVISGFLSEWVGYRVTYFLAVVPIVICVFIVASLKNRQFTRRPRASSR